MMGLTGFISLDNIKYLKTSLWDLSKYLQGYYFSMFTIQMRKEYSLIWEMSNICVILQVLYNV